MHYKCKKIFTVTIIGNYGATNLGDEAILSGILRELPYELKCKLKINLETELIVQVLSYDPQTVKRIHPFINALFLLPFGVRSLIRGIFRGELYKSLIVLRKSDLVIIGGGGLFTDEKITAVIMWAYHFICAKVISKQVWMYAQSVGPLRYGAMRFIVKFCFNHADFISVRDKSSKNLLQQLGVSKNINVRIDPAFNLKNDPRLISARKTFQFWLDQHNLNIGSYVTVSLRTWPSFTIDKQKDIARYLDYLIEIFRCMIVFLPFQKISCDDTKILMRIKSLVLYKENIIIEPYSDNLWNIIQIIAHSKFLIGMRLHSLIFAEIVRTTYMALCYSDKIWGFLEEVNKTEQGIDVSNISFSSLVKYFQKRF